MTADTATVARNPATFSPFEAWIATFPPEQRQDAAAAFYRNLPAIERDTLRYKWVTLWARPNQRPPTGNWDTWMIRAGRGYGKTRVGSETVRRRVVRGKARAVTIIGPTAADARDVMIEGPESGLLAVHPPDVRPVYKPSVRTLEWPNGAIGHVRSAEEPDSVRGLNSDLVWGDEPASWKTGSAAWDNAMLGNRLGRDPRSILTGTPRPLPWLRALEERARTVVTTGSTYENLGNLAETFVQLILDRYEGTRLGRQELHALYLEDVEGALWTLATIEITRTPRWSPADPWTTLRAEVLRMRTALGLGAVVLPKDRRRWRILVGVDPPGETAECGIIVAAAPVNPRATDHAVVIDDMSIAGPPETWGSQVVAAVRKYAANGVVVEANQGGDMTRSTIHNVDPDTKVLKVRAKDSKQARAEPVSVLYARGRVHHAGWFKALEDQMTTWVPGEKSPDRMDALVHVINALLPPMKVPTSRISVPGAA